MSRILGYVIGLAVIGLIVVGSHEGLQLLARSDDAFGRRAQATCSACHGG